jgi:hypothetical protein
MKRRLALAELAAIALLMLAPVPGSAEGQPGAAAAPAPATPVEARGSPYKVAAKIDWKARVMSLRVTLDLEAAGLRLPSGRLEAERMTERDLAGLARPSVFSVRFDSYRTVEDTIADGTLDAQKILSLPAAAKLASSSLTKDLRAYAADYELGLDSVAALYLDGYAPAPSTRPVDAVPTRDYTGIVVYAKGELPVRGEAVKAKAAPCLFPRIFDDGMRLVLDRDMVSPEALASGGVLGYADAIGFEAGSRVGGDPLRVMALEVFGDGRTDYVISRQDAMRILSSAANRELLRQGKVVVVLDL